MLTVTNLSKSFSKKLIYENFQMNVNKGEIFALIGPNGIGKTTLIRMILGLDCDYQGEIHHEPHTIGYSPESPLFPKILTGRELLTLIKNEQKTNDDIDELMERVGLEPNNTTKVGNYSKGMVQRLAIAQSLIGNPDILLLDEPSSGLDYFGQIAMQELIESLKSEKKAIVLNSHLLWDVEKICDRGVIIMGPKDWREFSKEEFQKKSLGEIFLDFGKEVQYESH